MRVRSRGGRTCRGSGGGRCGGGGGRGGKSRGDGGDGERLLAWQGEGDVEAEVLGSKDGVEGLAGLGVHLPDDHRPVEAGLHLRTRGEGGARGERGGEGGRETVRDEGRAWEAAVGRTLMWLRGNCRSSTCRWPGE